MSQIDRVTEEVRTCLLENDELQPLYRHATAVCLNLEELHRNFHHGFQEYAWHLDNFARNEVESLVACAVRKNAWDLVRYIVEKYDTEREAIQTQENGFDEEVDAHVSHGNKPLGQGEVQEFLLRGEAFTTFCTRLRSLHQETGYPEATGKTIDDTKTVDKGASRRQGDSTTTPAMLNLGNTIKGESEPPRGFLSVARGIPKTMRTLTSSAMIAIGCLEPPLRPGLTRLRWQCQCGTSLHDDVRELRVGGLAKLVKNLQNATGTTVAVTTYNQGYSDWKYTFQYPSFVRKITQKVAAAFGESKDHSPRLPEHMSTPTTLTTVATTPSSSPNLTLHMMACMRLGRHGLYVYQDPMDEINTDRALFSFIRTQLAQRRGYLRSVLSWNCVQDIYFVKFRLRLGGSAELRVDGSSCASRAQLGCECIPPSTNTEYDCSPAGPPETCPPVNSQYLMHMLTSPECKIDKKQTWVLNQLPKRRGQLDVKVNEYADGWGLHFKEDLDGRILSGMVFIVLTFSFLFSVLWSSVEEDIQGGFGVGSYIVAAVAVPAALALNRSGKLG
ncbi:hypothetical protein HBI81_129790 [Parastagonospora nodorum]|nr:hypothetical protein HBI10_146900 [Parastagonospora nodorum]KAH4019953.1 hypothetical protein HBI13_120050 [Parastagonospora nodorum]KAH4118663.1 hypothetical protein HBH47_136840 [Parastagonospora nodorum]KAH4405994.1 hypothetical protein HBH92_173070 [Parastagonospora nodorum]KAH4562348.1 hypothetical protein HBH86_055800 [Parastagonospora nodorum]